jgi:hypothetical protein
MNKNGSNFNNAGLLNYVLEAGKKLLNCIDKFQNALIAADTTRQKKEIVGREIFLSKWDEESEKQ